MKVLLVDDHALFRDGLLLVLEGLKQEIQTFEAGSYESAERIMLAQPDVDLVLLDLGLPGTSYLDALQAIQKQLPNALIVILSGTEDCKMVEAALRNGARGYIPKSSSAQTMLNALQLIIAGDTYIPTQILQKNISASLAPVSLAPASLAPASLAPASLAPASPNPTPLNSNPVNNTTPHKLTPRQHDVLLQLATGKSNKGIAKQLNLTESTVRAHVAAILKSFNVSNRTHAVQYAAHNSWL